MMPFIRALMAVLVTAGLGLAAAGPAPAGQKSKKPSKKRLIIIDRSRYYGPPPPPHERRYVGPAPAIAPPMRPVPRVAPLAQPPIR